MPGGNLDKALSSSLRAARSAYSSLYFSMLMLTELFLLLGNLAIVFVLRLAFDVDEVN